MRLNPDCVRDILLTIEEVTDFNNFWEYSSDSSFKRLEPYSHSEIIYHISQCEKASLIDGVESFDDGESINVGDLTPSGHEFLANIRSESMWNTVKDVGKKVGSSSLSSLLQIASGIVTCIIKSQLGLT